jgi:hypothetical protein
MKKVAVFVPILVGFLMIGCSGVFKNQSDDKVIASVGAKKLTYLQLKAAVPPNMKEIDSISFSQNYIEKWVKNQLLLEKAELNLDKNAQNSIDEMIDNYRTSLLLFKYQQMFINQKLDTMVAENQIADYYSDHSENFKLDSNAVKAIFVQLPKSVHNGINVGILMRSGIESDLAKLEDYCYQNANNFYLGEEWQYLGSLLNRIPHKSMSQEVFLTNNRYLEAFDSTYNYYLYVVDYRMAGDTEPLVFVKSQIKDILINSRKVKLIKDLENNIYNDAVNKKKFTIYTN